MHSGVKSAVALDAVAKLTRNNAELHAKDPARYPLKSKQESILKQLVSPMMLLEVLIGSA